MIKMINKKIYAKNNFKINEYEIYVYDSYLEKLLFKAIANNYNTLANYIITILQSKNKMNISSTINKLVNYSTKDIVENEIVQKTLFCIVQNRKLERLNIQRLLLSLDYQFELKTSYHEFDDEIIFSDKVNSIPYINSIKTLNK